MDKGTLLQSDVVQNKECRSYLSTTGKSGFQRKISKTMEVYVDDMVVKSKKKTDHLEDLAESFNLLYKYRINLNSKKYNFGV